MGDRSGTTSTLELSHLRVIGPVGAGRDRQANREGRPAVLATTVDRDRATMHLHQLPHNRQTQAESTSAPRGRTIRLPETLEDIRQKLWRDADARVGYAELDFFADSQQSQRDLSSRRGKFHG